MTIEKQPFKAYTLDEEKDDNSEVFSVRINKQEREMLEEIKEDFNIKSDGKALKFAAEIGRNVTQALLGRKRLQYLFKNERQKLTDYKNY